MVAGVGRGVGNPMVADDVWVVYDVDQMVSGRKQKSSLPSNFRSNSKTGLARSQSLLDGKNKLVRSASDLSEILKGSNTWSSQHPVFKTSDDSAVSVYGFQTSQYDDGTSTRLISEVEERTLKPVSEESGVVFWEDDNDTGVASLETVHTKVRRAMSDMHKDLKDAMQKSDSEVITDYMFSDVVPDLENSEAMELVKDFKEEFTKELVECEERTRKLRAELAVEEHRELELNKILSDMIPEPETPKAQKPRLIRKEVLESHFDHQQPAHNILQTTLPSTRDQLTTNYKLHLRPPRTTPSTPSPCHRPLYLSSHQKQSPQLLKRHREIGGHRGDAVLGEEKWDRFEVELCVMWVVSGGLKVSTERRKMSKRLEEEAMAYFDECVSISTFDDSDFSSLEDPPSRKAKICETSDVPVVPDPNSISWSIECQDVIRQSSCINLNEASNLSTSAISNNSRRSSLDCLSRRPRFSFTSKLSDSTSDEQGIRNLGSYFSKNKQEEFGKSHVVQAVPEKSNRYDSEIPADKFLLDKMTFRKRIDSGGMLLCSGGIGFHRAPFSSNFF
ncbi:hypothetical protein KSS87_003095 [Heliosperma pusillum]|nr:hypothetical protein KSS87_003095 [Heliosperma pusillum]